MSRPDGVGDELGLKVLDEPAPNQSDATVLELQLRAISKKQHGGDGTVRGWGGGMGLPRRGGRLVVDCDCRWPRLMHTRCLGAAYKKSGPSRAAEGRSTWMPASAERLFG
jgi:hypothetical protein